MYHKTPDFTNKIIVDNNVDIIVDKLKLEVTNKLSTIYIQVYQHHK